MALGARPWALGPKKKRGVLLHAALMPKAQGLEPMAYRASVTENHWLGPIGVTVSFTSLPSVAL